MNKKNQKRSYVAPELTETIYFVPEKGFANSEVKTKALINGKVEMKTGGIINTMTL